MSRTVGVGAATVALTAAVLGTPAVFRRVSEPCPGQICQPFERPTGQTLEILGSVGVSITGYAATVSVVSWALLALYLVVGLVVVWRRPSMLAVVTAASMVGLGLAPFLDALASEGRTAKLLATVLAIAVEFLLVLLLGLFPDGRWHPVWLGKVWPLFAVVMAGPHLGDAAFGPLQETWLSNAADILPFLGLLGMQIHRYLRVSDWTARQQAKWVLLSFLLLGANVIIANVLNAADALAGWQLGTVLIAYVSFAMFGVGLALALLRYRLYDVGVVLRRTAVYAGAVIVLLAGYLAVVALATLSMARASASVIGAAVVAALALCSGLLAAGFWRWFRNRLLGARSRPGGVAAALAQGIAAASQSDIGLDRGSSANLAETIAAALDLPYVAVQDRSGRTLWTHGEPTGAPHRELVVDGAGTELGTLLLSPSHGTRLNRQGKRALREVLPFVVLVLRAQHDAEELRVARAAAATSREDERRRLRRDLHDGVGPLLASQLLTLDTLRVSTGRGMTAEELLAHLESQARSAITEVRRISRDLRPAALDAGGLQQALQDETQRLQASGLPVTLVTELEGAALPAAVEVAVLRIVQEALTNVVRHAHATHAAVRVAVTEGMIEVTIEDNGRGHVEATAGGGTAFMRERAQELGGTLDIGPGSHGRGARVSGRIPL